MSNRARELSEEIAKELRDAISNAHDKLIHLAFLHSPNASEGNALEQANKDISEMLMFYVMKFTSQ